MAVARAELLVPAQTAAHSCQESTVAVHPVTHPRVWPVTPQENARPELLMESPPKRYPVQEPGSAAAQHATGAESAEKLFSRPVLSTSFCLLWS